MSFYESDLASLPAFISQQGLQQIVSQLAQHNACQQSQLLCNYEALLEVFASLMRGEMLVNNKPLPAHMTDRLLHKYSPSALIYAIACTAFQVHPSLINFAPLERHRFFLTSFPSQPSILLETFINILDQRRIVSMELAQHLLDRISSRMRAALERERSEPSTLTVHHSGKERACYRTTCTISSSRQDNLERETLIYSIDSTFFDGGGEKKGFYRELFKKMQEKFGPAGASAIVDQALLLHAVVTFLETATMRLPKTATPNHNHNHPQQTHSAFPMEMPFYAELADIDHFQLAITFLQADAQKRRLELAINIKSQKIGRIRVGEFQQRQKNLQRDLSEATQKITTKLAFVQNLVYLIDSEAKLGKGTFGLVFRCEALQLLEQRTTAQGRSFSFRKRTVAAKQFTLTPQEQRRLQIPLSREHLILSLADELRHREAIKDVERELGYQVERSLIGIKNIVPMIEFFKARREGDKKGKEAEDYFIMLELGQATLSNSDFQSSFYSSEPFFTNAHSLFLNIFQGLFCLHFDINNLYPHELNRYYQWQNNDEANHERDDLKSLHLMGKNGICHRDMKPTNIVVSWDRQGRVGEVFLIDFGMAKIGELSTRNGATSCGSSYYMAPEIRNGTRQDERVDVWSVGVFMFEMLGRDKGTKLYSTVEAHTMNKVNQHIEKHIDQLLHGQQWAIVLRQALTLQIEPQDIRDSAVRSNSAQILHYLLTQALLLTTTDLTPIFHHFHHHAYTSRLQGKCRNIQKINRSLPSLDQLRENFLITKCLLRQYLRHSFSQQAKIIVMMAALAQAAQRNPNFSLNQLRQFLGTLQVIVISPRRPLHDGIDEYTVIIKQASQPQLSTDDLIKDLHQTVCLGEVGGQQGEWVLLSTESCLQVFAVPLTPTNTNYYHGYTLEEDNSIVCKMYSLDQTAIHPWCPQQQCGSDRLFIRQAHLNHFDLFSLKPTLQTNIGHFSKAQLLQMAADVISFIGEIRHQRKVVVEEGDWEVDCGSLVHLVHFQEANSETIKVAYHPTLLKSILQHSSAAFEQEIRTWVCRLIKLSHVLLTYNQKVQISIYLASSCFHAYHRRAGEVSHFCSYHHVLGDFQVVQTGLHYLGSCQKLQRERKETFRMLDALQKTKQLINIIASTHLGPKLESWQMPMLRNYIAVLRAYFRQLPDKFQARQEKTFKIALLVSLSGCQITSMMLLLNIYVEACYPYSDN